MIPRWHILFGAIFTILVWIVFPNISPVFYWVIFLSTFMIDIDHYLLGVAKTGKWGLFSSLEYFRMLVKKEKHNKMRGIRKKGNLFVIHTIEVLAVLGVLGYYSDWIFYMFVGFIFHFLVDLVGLIYNDEVYRRYFFLVDWLKNSKES